MTTDERGTIFALSSGQPPAAIAIIRISGPGAEDAARQITGCALPEPRRAALRAFRDPATGEMIDEGLLLWFPATESVTGETLVELHCHGSRAVVRDLSHVLAALPGLRPAEAGDFTRRAFANGRMDLATVEGLGDLLTAETALQRRAALAMASGALSQRIAIWTAELRRLSARVEASLDFSDEGDVAQTGAAVIGAACKALADEMTAELAKPGSERLKDGIRVAIGGPPNVGKSTLFNHLVGRDAAIVSPLAGTTRDVIEASIAIAGIPILLSDSAGLRESEDVIEQIGVGRAASLLADADIVLWLGLPDMRPVTDGTILQIYAKADIKAEDAFSTGLSVSAVSGAGMDALTDQICDTAKGLLPRPGDYALSQRQRDVLARATSSVHEAAKLHDDILIAECLRLALATLDELTGRVTTEAMLDELFSGFCIGK